MSATRPIEVAPLRERAYTFNEEGIMSPPDFNEPIPAGGTPCWFKEPAGAMDEKGRSEVEESRQAAVGIWNHAVAHWRARNVTAALEMFEGALALALDVNPDNAVALNNLGVLELFRGNPEEAARYFEKAVRAASDDREAARYLVNRGVTADHSHDYRAARYTYRRALALDPESDRARVNLRSVLALPAVRFAAGLRHPVGSSGADADYPFGVGFVWRLWDLNSSLGIGPQGEFAFNFGDHHNAAATATAGLALVFQRPSYGAWVARAGIGGGDAVGGGGGDMSNIPIRSGWLFNYGLDLLTPISHQWWVGLALSMQHEMAEPGRLAFTPGVVLTGMPW